MTIFIDTSALYAVIDADDHNHERAKDQWTILLRRDTPLITTNYVLVECFALMQNRLGMAAVRTFYEDIIPVLETTWITESHHESGVAAVFARDQRQLSLVDCISFDTMQRLDIETAFAFDQDFVEQGFTCIP